MTFGTDESVLFMEVSLIQSCPYRERFHCSCIVGEKSDLSYWSVIFDVLHLMYSHSELQPGPLLVSLAGYRGERERERERARGRGGREGGRNGFATISKITSLQ